MATDSRTQSESQIRSSELVVLLRGWRERAQQCKDETRAIREDHGKVTVVGNELLARARCLEDCARELEITMQHNGKGQR